MASLPAPGPTRGDRVELISLTDGYRRFGLTAGERGTVDFTDSIGAVHVKWDNGQQVGITAESRGLIRPISS